MRMASSNRSVPRASELAVYSGVFEANLDMALSSQVVNLIGLVVLDQTNEIGGICQIAVMHEKARITLVRINVEIIYTSGIE